MYAVTMARECTTALPRHIAVLYYKSLAEWATFMKYGLISHSFWFKAQSHICLHFNDKALNYSKISKLVKGHDLGGAIYVHIPANNQKTNQHSFCSKPSIITYCLLPACFKMGLTIDTYSHIIIIPVM